MRRPIESVKLGKLPGTPCLPFVMRLACKRLIRRLSWTNCGACTILRWQGYLPLYLPLILCNCVMNTIMRIMNFTIIRYFTLWTLVSLKFGCAHSKFRMHTLDKHAHHPSIIFSFCLSKMVVHRRDMAEVPSLGIFFNHSWLFDKLKTKAYLERCRACRTKDWMWEEAIFSAQ